MMDYWSLTGLTNDQISQAFLTSVDEEITRLKEIDIQKYGEEKNPIRTHEKVSLLYFNGNNVSLISNGPRPPPHKCMRP